MRKFVSCSAPHSLRDFVQLKECGGIEDVGLALHWDAATLEKEVLRRAVVLDQMGIKPGSTVAIGHGGHRSVFCRPVCLLARWSGCSLP
jgi:hypothetical protein